VELPFIDESSSSGSNSTVKLSEQRLQLFIVSISCSNIKSITVRVVLCCFVLDFIDKELALGTASGELKNFLTKYFGAKIFIEFFYLS
jgi:hypothetical protein